MPDFLPPGATGLGVCRGKWVKKNLELSGGATGRRNGNAQQPRSRVRGVKDTQLAGFAVSGGHVAGGWELADNGEKVIVASDQIVDVLEPDGK